MKDARIVKILILDGLHQDPTVVVIVMKEWNLKISTADIVALKGMQDRMTPYQEMIQCIYGPCPEVRVHTCRKCGYRWETVLMIDHEKYCPNCGGKAPVTDSREWKMNPGNSFDIEDTVEIWGEEF